MKRQVFFVAICLLLSHSGFTQGGAIYLEFYGNGMLHRGVLSVDAQGRGQCRIAFQSQQGIVAVDQLVQQRALPPQPGYYYPSQPQQQDVVFTCASPTLANTGQYVQSYAPDNFYLLGNGQMVNCDANGGRCPVNYRPIQSQQEFQAILQSLGGNTTPSYPTGGGGYPQPPQPAPRTNPTPPPTPQSVPTVPTTTPKPKGPKYPTKPGGGLGD